jgi:hypothetical protein
MTHVRIALAVLAGLVTLVLPAPASAVASFTWIEAPCATGAITEYAGSADGRVSLSGWVQPCGEPTPDASFGIMRYHENTAMLFSTVSSQMVRPYQSTTAPTAFTVEYNVDAREGLDVVLGLGAVRAICVVRGWYAPVACVGIDRPAGGGAPTVTPISTDNARTCVPEIGLPADKKTNPACGSCV